MQDGRKFIGSETVTAHLPFKTDVGCGYSNSTIFVGKIAAALRTQTSGPFEVLPPEQKEKANLCCERGGGGVVSSEPPNPLRTGLGKNVTAVFLDIRNAFDSVWHPGLLYQLSTLVISEWSAKWLTSYLSERQISVHVGSTMSECKTISCGVRQGSQLGPVLFIVFINNPHPLWAFPLKFLLMTLPCTMSTANSVHVQHIQLYRRRLIALKSGVNLGMAKSVMQRRGFMSTNKDITMLESLTQQRKDMQVQ